MSQYIVPPAAVEYPCSDGQPMAETPVHRRCMTYLIDALERHLRTGVRCPAYVSGNMFLYYEEGNPRAVVAPDVFVALGVPDRDRDTYLLWEESKGPDFVVEVSSRSTRREDQGRKREVYARLGVSEYFLYDPRAEYLNPPLRGFSGCAEASTILCWRAGRRRGHWRCVAKFWGWSFETRGKNNCCAFTIRRPGTSFSPTVSRTRRAKRRSQPGELRRCVSGRKAPPGRHWKTASRSWKPVSVSRKIPTKRPGSPRSSRKQRESGARLASFRAQGTGTSPVSREARDERQFGRAGVGHACTGLGRRATLRPEQVPRLGVGCPK